MRQQQPILRDDRAPPTTEHHFAYHEAFLSRLEQLQPPSSRSRPPNTSIANDEHLISVLRRIEGALSAEATPPRQNFHQEVRDVNTTGSSSSTSTEEHVQIPTTPVTHNRVPLTTEASPPTAHAATEQPPPPPPNIAQSIQWYRDYVGWVLYYRACAQHYKALAEQRSQQISTNDQDEALLYQT
ncbi:Hypothetical protein, putative [Bodo saltans]|uniref:Uncharacterized protein n=1 Tax=Bodo saltans TaxID=75058 RepID=A0A0S4JTP0_BODSA|nr:Hypothetical protein, putative [Bodo saltans]|eukprot:CUG93752.1 Hypothetical protein, putative [Bodo saltans]